MSVSNIKKYEELQKQIQKLEQEQQELFESAKQESIQKIDAILSETGFSLFDLYPEIKSGQSVKKVILKVDDKTFIRVANSTRGKLKDSIKQILDEKNLNPNMKKSELFERFEKVDSVPENQIVIE